MSRSERMRTVESLRQKVNSEIRRVRALMEKAPPEQADSMAGEIRFAEQALRANRRIDLARAHSNLRRTTILTPEEWAETKRISLVERVAIWLWRRLGARER